MVNKKLSNAFTQMPILWRGYYKIHVCYKAAEGFY